MILHSEILQHIYLRIGVWGSFVRALEFSARVKSPVQSGSGSIYVLKTKFSLDMGSVKRSQLERKRHRPWFKYMFQIKRMMMRRRRREGRGGGERRIIMIPGKSLHFSKL